MRLRSRHLETNSKADGRLFSSPLLRRERAPKKCSDLKAAFSGVPGPMPEPTSLWDVLSEAGLPAVGGLLAWGLVIGADALEADAKEERLKYISGLLKEARRYFKWVN